MLKIINAKFASGTLHSFEISGSKFGAVTAQTNLIGDNRAKKLAALSDSSVDDGVFDAEGADIFPGFIDAHIHSRDPGLSHKEDWSTLASGAYKGGVVCVCDMPNTIPPAIDRAAVLGKAKIAAQSGLDFRFFLGVVPSNIDRLGELAVDKSLPLCGLKIYYGHSTGGLVFSDLELLQQKLPADFDAVIVFHSEDQCVIDHNCNKLVKPGTAPAIVDNASFAIHSQIRSSAAAFTSTKVILEWAKKYRRKVHIAHLSTPKEVELIEAAKKSGVVVTSEVAPHHLLLCTDDYPRLGPFLKMNPPVRSREEMQMLRRHVGEGKIEVFATDHAPHTIAEKKTKYEDCPSGIPAIEFFTGLLLECARVTNLPLADAVKMATINPAKIFSIPKSGDIVPGFNASFSCVKMEDVTVDDQDIASKCRWTPYAGANLPGFVKATWHLGKRVYLKS
jgi:dihydroorotase